MHKYIKLYVCIYTYKYTLLYMPIYVIYYYIYIGNEVDVATCKYTYECRYINKYKYIPNCIDMYNVHECSYILIYYVFIKRRRQTYLPTYM